MNETKSTARFAKRRMNETINRQEIAEILAAPLTFEQSPQRKQLIIIDGHAIHSTNSEGVGARSGEPHIMAPNIKFWNFSVQILASRGISDIECKPFQQSTRRPLCFDNNVTRVGRWIEYDKLVKRQMNVETADRWVFFVETET